MSKSGAPIWQSRDRPTRAALGQDRECDIAIVGAGIVGLALAHRLQAAGDVCLLEARRTGEQATGRSTAKLTAQHHLIYRRLARDIGTDGARAYGRANMDAVRWAEEASAGQQGLFRRVPAYVYALDDSERSAVDHEAEVAAKLGLPARFAAQPDLPFRTSGAVVFDDQGAIDPIAFADHLVETLPANVTLYENSRIERIDYGEPATLHTRGQRVRARWVVVATHLPTVPYGHYYAKAYPQAHVLMAAPAPPSLPDGMFISAGSPTRSFRKAAFAERDHIVATGEAFKPGDVAAQRAAADGLERFLREHFAVSDINHRWVNEDFTPMDDLPFVGAVSRSRPRLMVATGFNAWGLSTGIVAADIIAAAIGGRSHPLADILAADRLRPSSSARRFVTENGRAGTRLVGDRLKLLVKPGDLPERPGQGTVIRRNGQAVAVSRDEGGALVAVSARCTHLGCLVSWNDIDRTWDCPCHGSRFGATGKVRYGPATTPLAPVEIELLEKHRKEGGK